MSIQKAIKKARITTIFIGLFLSFSPVGATNLQDDLIEIVNRFQEDHAFYLDTFIKAQNYAVVTIFKDKNNLKDKTKGINNPKSGGMNRVVLSGDELVKHLSVSYREKTSMIKDVNVVNVYDFDGEKERVFKKDSMIKSGFTKVGQYIDNLLETIKVQNNSELLLRLLEDRYQYMRTKYQQFHQITGDMSSDSIFIYTIPEVVYLDDVNRIAQLYNRLKNELLDRLIKELIHKGFGKKGEQLSSLSVESKAFISAFGSMHDYLLDKGDSLSLDYAFFSIIRLPHNMHGRFKEGLESTQEWYNPLVKLKQSDAYLLEHFFIQGKVNPNSDPDAFIKRLQDHLASKGSSTDDSSEEEVDNWANNSPKCMSNQCHTHTDNSNTITTENADVSDSLEHQTNIPTTTCERVSKENTKEEPDSYLSLMNFLLPKPVDTSSSNDKRDEGGNQLEDKIGGNKSRVFDRDEGGNQLTDKIEDSKSRVFDRDEGGNQLEDKIGGNKSRVFDRDEGGNQLEDKIGGNKSRVFDRDEGGNQLEDKIEDNKSRVFGDVKFVYSKRAAKAYENASKDYREEHELLLKAFAKRLKANNADDVSSNYLDLDNGVRTYIEKFKGLSYIALHYTNRASVYHRTYLAYDKENKHYYVHAFATHWNSKKGKFNKEFS